MKCHLIFDYLRPGSPPDYMAADPDHADCRGIIDALTLWMKENH